MNYLILECEHCGNKFKIPIDKLPTNSLTRKCSKCQKVIVIPARAAHQTHQEHISTGPSKIDTGTAIPPKRSPGVSSAEHSTHSDDTSRKVRSVSTDPKPKDPAVNAIGKQEHSNAGKAAGKFIGALFAQILRTLSGIKPTVLAAGATAIAIVLAIPIFTSETSPPDQLLDAPVVIREGVVDFNITPRQIEKELLQAAERSDMLTVEGWEETSRGYLLRVRLEGAQVEELALDYASRRQPDGSDFVFMSINDQSFFGTRQLFLGLSGAAKTINEPYAIQDSLKELTYDDIKYSPVDPAKYSAIPSNIEYDSALFKKISDYPRNRFTK